MIHTRTGHLFLTADRFGIDPLWGGNFPLHCCCSKVQNPTVKPKPNWQNLRKFHQKWTHTGSNQDIHPRKHPTKLKHVILKKSWCSYLIIPESPCTIWLKTKNNNESQLQKKIPNPRLSLSASYFLTHLLHVWSIIFTYIYHEFVVKCTSFFKVTFCIPPMEVTFSAHLWVQTRSRFEELSRQMPSVKLT